MIRAAALATLFFASNAAAQTVGIDEIKDLSRYDRDGSGRIDTPEEARVLGLHRISPTLRAFDDDEDGQLSDEELAALGRSVNALSAPGTEISSADLMVLGTTNDSAAHGGILAPRPDGSTGPVTPVSGSRRCTDARSWYVRRDRTEINGYSNTIDLSEVKGASVVLTNDDLADAESVEVHGVVARTFTNTCFAPTGSRANETYLATYSVAGYLLADGLRTDIEPDKDKSTLRLGVDFQWGFFNAPIFSSQYVTLSPYVQSDFRGDAEVFGAAASWEPYSLRHRINGTYQPALWGWDYFWDVRADADWMHVEDAGFSGLTADTDYAWFGGQLGFTAFPAADALGYRLKLYGSWNYHRDVNEGLDARLYKGGASWDLVPSGAIAVSLERAWGVEREKLEEVERTTLSLDFKL